MFLRPKIRPERERGGTPRHLRVWSSPLNPGESHLDITRSTLDTNRRAAFRLMKVHALAHAAAVGVSFCIDLENRGVSGLQGILNRQLKPNLLSLSELDALGWRYSHYPGVIRARRTA